MEIQKSDLLQFVAKITGQKGNQKTDMSNSQTAQQSEKNKPSVTVDSLRNQITSIQSEMKELQTQITARQTSIEIVKFSKINNWQSELKKFMKKMPGLTLQPTKDMTREIYTQRVSEELGELKNNLIKKDIQMQNIFSSNILAESEVVKDFSHSKDVFSNINKANIQNILT